MEWNGVGVGCGVVGVIPEAGWEALGLYGGDCYPGAAAPCMITSSFTTASAPIAIVATREESERRDEGRELDGGRWAVSATRPYLYRAYMRTACNAHHATCESAPQTAASVASHKTQCASMHIRKSTCVCTHAHAHPSHIPPHAHSTPPSLETLNHCQSSTHLPAHRHDFK